MAIVTGQLEILLGRKPEDIETTVRRLASSRRVVVEFGEWRR